MKIVVLDGHTLNPGDLSWEPVERLGELTVHERTPSDKIVERAKGAEVVLTNKTPLSAQTIDALSELKFIGVLATGFNVVDIEAARARGIAVSNVPEYSTDSVAEWTFGAILALARRFEQHSDAVMAGRWSSSPDFSFTLSPQVELRGKTLGVVGFGRIGRRVAAVGDAFGMKIIAASRRQIDPPAYEGFAWASLNDIFGKVDVLCLHCPLTDQTKGLANAARLATMKRTAWLINAARGPVVDEQALADALNGEVIAGAAVDVTSQEPLNADSPLLGARNLIITPHIAWTTAEARARLMDVTAANIAGYAKGELINVVNGVG